MPWTVASAHLPSLLPTLNHLDFAWRQSPRNDDRFCGDGLGVEISPENHQVRFLLFDVTGKGRSAAETVEFVEMLLSAGSLENLPPEELLTNLHAQLQAHFNDTGRFVEAIAIQYDGETGMLRASGAGAISTLHFRDCSGSGCDWIVSGAGLLGIPHTEVYESSSHSLPDGTVVLGFTDGISDAGVRSTDRFASSALSIFLRQNPYPTSPIPLLESLWSAIMAHAPSDWNEDDITAMSLCRKK